MGRQVDRRLGEGRAEMGVRQGEGERGRVEEGPGEAGDLLIEATYHLQSVQLPAQLPTYLPAVN